MEKTIALLTEADRAIEETHVRARDLDGATFAKLWHHLDEAQGHVRAALQVALLARHLQAEEVDE